MASSPSTGSLEGGEISVPYIVHEIHHPQPGTSSSGDLQPSATSSSKIDPRDEDVKLLVQKIHDSSISEEDQPGEQIISPNPSITSPSEHASVLLLALLEEKCRQQAIQEFNGGCGSAIADDHPDIVAVSRNAFKELADQFFEQGLVNLDERMINDPQNAERRKSYTNLLGTVLDKIVKRQKVSRQLQDVPENGESAFDSNNHPTATGLRTPKLLDASGLASGSPLKKTSQYHNLKVIGKGTYGTVSVPMQLVRA